MQTLCYDKHPELFNELCSSLKQVTHDLERLNYAANKRIKTFHLQNYY